MENKEKGSFTEVNPKVQQKSKVICKIRIVQHERTGLRRFDFESHNIGFPQLFCSFVGLLVIHFTVLKGLLLLLKLEVRSWGRTFEELWFVFSSPFVTSYPSTANSKATTILAYIVSVQKNSGHLHVDRIFIF